MTIPRGGVSESGSSSWVGPSTLETTEFYDSTKLRADNVESTWPTNTVAPQRTLFPGEPGEACAEWGSESRFGYPPEQATEPTNEVGGGGANVQKGPNKKPPPEDDDGLNATRYREEKRIVRHVTSVVGQESGNSIVVERNLIMIFRNQKSSNYSIFELDRTKQFAGA